MLSMCVLNVIPLLYVPSSVGAVLVQDKGLFVSIIVDFVLYLLDQDMISRCSSMLIYSCRWLSAMSTFRC